MKRFRAVIIAAALGSSLLAPNLPLDAQPTHTAARGNSVIEVKNVPAALMAYWIDPAHNTMPTALSSMSGQPDSRENVTGGGGGRGSAGGAGRGGASRGDQVQTPPAGVMQMPQGIDSVRPDNRTNALRVNGTAGGVAELRRIIELLDRPLQQVDIECSLVETNAREAQQPQTRSGGISVDIDRDNGAALTRLKAEPQATVQTFRLRTFNNTPASETRETTELLMISSADMPHAKLLSQRITRLECSVTPSINQDGTITIALAPHHTSRLVGDGLTDEQKIARHQQIDTITNVKNGETFVVRGLRADTFRSTGAVEQVGTADVETPDVAGNRREMLMFVTARIVPLEPPK